MYELARGDWLAVALFPCLCFAAPLGARPPGIAQLKIGSEPTPQTGSCGRESRVAAGDAPYLERGAGRRQEAAARSRAREWVTTVGKRRPKSRVEQCGWAPARWRGADPESGAERCGRRAVRRLERELGRGRGHRRRPAYLAKKKSPRRSAPAHPESRN